MKLSFKVLCIITISLVCSTSIFGQRKTKKDVGLERLNDNFGGDADTSVEGYEPSTFNGKLQVLIDPLTIFVNGRIYGEIQYAIKEDFLVCFGAGVHGLKKDQIHPVLNEKDPRVGQFFRIGIFEHGSSVLYHRIDVLFSNVSYLTYGDFYDGFGPSKIAEYETTAFKGGGFYSFGVHVPFAKVLFFDAFAGIGFMAGKPKKTLKNIYANGSMEVYSPSEFLGDGVGYFGYGGPSFQAGFRFGYVISK